MKNKSLGFIGGGRITRILLQAFRNKSVKLDNIAVFEPDSGILQKLQDLFPEIKPEGSPEGTARQEVVILAVHPPVIMDTLNKIKGVVNAETFIVSLAPKITTGKIADVLTANKVMRMIPNATSFLNDGFNPVSFHRNFPMGDKNTMLELFSILGETFEVDENKLEGYAIYSAMLPTYFWFQWKKLEELAVTTGLTREEAARAIRDTIYKSAGLLYDSGLSYDEVVDLIPVKPIGDQEEEIRNIYETKLIGLFEKIKP
jgi:pyrroline-5-carboxylate reductase